MKAFSKSKHSIIPNVFAVRQRVFDAENMNVREYRRFRSNSASNRHKNERREKKK